MEIIKPGYARITDIISDRESLMKIPPAILENARGRGERVDQLCKAYVLGLPANPENEEDAGLFASFQLWAQDKLDDLQIGTRLYDDELMLTGEPDLLWQCADCMVVVDLKCTAKPSMTWGLQGAGYARLEQSNGLQIDAIEFLRLKKDGKMPCGYEYEFESNWQMFLHFLHRYRFLEKCHEDMEEFYAYL